MDSAPIVVIDSASPKEVDEFTIALLETLLTFGYESQAALGLHPKVVQAALVKFKENQDDRRRQRNR